MDRDAQLAEVLGFVKKGPPTCHAVAIRTVTVWVTHLPFLGFLATIWLYKLIQFEVHRFPVTKTAPDPDFDDRLAWFGSRPGRMDRALQLAVPLAESETAAEFLAKQCSERAADAWFWMCWIDWIFINGHKSQIETWSRLLTVDMRVMVDFQISERSDFEVCNCCYIEIIEVKFVHFACACQQFMSWRSSPFWQSSASLPRQHIETARRPGKWL